ncbi:hypothetical protein EV424DRAFT_1539312 [Suillus variegatus]|nr:hypothetical protein EV424DRAFT_1539312 [Suillus variegatus]
MPAYCQQRRKPTAFKVSFLEELADVKNNTLTDITDHGECYRPPFGELVPEHMCFYIKYMVPLLELDRSFEPGSSYIFGAGMASIDGHQPVYIYIEPLRHYDVNLTDADG